MDEILRRRLVGAAVLLTAAFAVASLLPEPRPPDVVAEPVVRYDLRTGKPIEPVRTPPRGAAAPAPPAVATAPSPETAAPQRKALKVDETLGGHAGNWYVQVGSFESQTNARKVLQELYGAGLPTILQTVTVGKSLWYRVRVGPFTGEDAAQRALAQVRKQGYATAKIVRPESGPAARN